MSTGRVGGAAHPSGREFQTLLERVAGLATGLAILLLSGYALATTQLFALGTPLVLALSLLSFVFAVATNRFQMRVDDPRVLVWFVLVSGILVSALFDSGMAPLNSAVSMVAFVTSGFLLTFVFDRHTFFEYSLRWMDWITLIGVAATSVIVLLGADAPLGLVENRNGVTYVNGYVFFLIQKLQQVFFLHHCLEWLNCAA